MSQKSSLTQPAQAVSGALTADTARRTFTKIGTYEAYRVKCNLVNGLPPRYRGESD
jgi:hypothetical protein